jgi:hypothetical protein
MNGSHRGAIDVEHGRPFMFIKSLDIGHEFGLGAIDATRAYTVVRDYSAAFFGQHVLARAGSSGPLKARSSPSMATRRCMGGPATTWIRTGPK